MPTVSSLKKNRHLVILTIDYEGDAKKKVLEMLRQVIGEPDNKLHIVNIDHYRLG